MLSHLTHIYDSSLNHDARDLTMTTQSITNSIYNLNHLYLFIINYHYFYFFFIFAYFISRIFMYIIESLQSPLSRSQSSSSSNHDVIIMTHHDVMTPSNNDVINCLPIVFPNATGLFSTKLYIFRLPFPRLLNKSCKTC